MTKWDESELKKPGIDFFIRNKIEEGNIIITGGEQATIVKVDPVGIIVKFNNNTHADKYIKYISFNDEQVEILNECDDYIEFNQFVKDIKNANIPQILKGLKCHKLEGDAFNALQTLVITTSNDSDQFKIFQLLLEKKFLSLRKINSLFIYAVGQGMLDLVDLLLKNGADISYQNFLAIQIVDENQDVRDLLLSHKEVIEFLIKNEHYDLLPKNIQDMFVF